MFYGGWMHDAEPVEWAPNRRRRVDPAHPYIWIHVAGAWREGALMKWIQDHDGRWLVWTSYTNPDGWAYPAHGLFAYSPDTVRLRGDGYPKPDD
jgi:hypothetical protein